MLGRFLFLLFFAISLFPLQSAETYTVKGRIIGKLSRKPIPYAGVSLFGYPGKATSSDSLGLFSIRLVPPILLAFSPFVWFRPVCTVYRLRVSVIKIF